ncbi:MAG TPA: hypothetical protein VFA58_06220 [Chthoniobacterales bacterium]|nr:hypothetical protein [Chthoniobacterales bacterium]
MDDPSGQNWFLRKYQDGAIYGPISFEQLANWAAAAQVAPHDLVSSDQLTWLKAPMLPQLAMDWLVEVTSEHLYGPTTVGAIQEFLRLGDINADTMVINSCDGTRRQIRELPMLFKINAPRLRESEATEEPASSGISIRLQERIRDLEQALREERRAYTELEEKYNALLQRSAPDA